MKKKIIAVLLSLSILFLVAAAADAAAATNQVSISQVIKLIVNGKTISAGTNGEPVILKGRTLVPIRVVAEALNLKVDWDNKLKTVKITGKTADTEALAQKDKTIENLTMQLAQKNSEIQSLKDEINSLKKDNKKNNTGLGDLEDDLISDYDYLKTVKIDDISLSGDEDDVTVKIEVDLGSYKSKWKNLTDSEIKSWIKNLVNSIQDELSSSTQVTGKIIDNDSDDTLVNFSKNGTSSLAVTFTDTDKDYRVDTQAIEDVEDSLKDDSFSVKGITFKVTSASYSSYNVTVKLKANDADADTEWEGLDSDDIESKVKDICETISDTFEDDADVNLELVRIYFYSSSQELLDSFTYDPGSKHLR
jgi:hypothetical protein